MNTTDPNSRIADNRPVPSESFSVSSVGSSFEPSFEQLTGAAHARPVIIVGAGLAGLVAANALAVAGRSARPSLAAATYGQLTRAQATMAAPQQCTHARPCAPQA